MRQEPEEIGTSHIGPRKLAARDLERLIDRTKRPPNHTGGRERCEHTALVLDHWFAIKSRLIEPRVIAQRPVQVFPYAFDAAGKAVGPGHIGVGRQV
jgi:hypothetical protein